MRVQENLVRGFFSRLVSEAAKKEHACGILDLYFSEYKADQQSCQLRLLHHAKNIKATEVVTTLDYLDDQRILGQMAQQHGDGAGVSSQVSDRESLKHLEGDFYLMASELACANTFHAKVAEPFIKLRMMDYQSKGHHILRDGPAYNVYQWK